MKKTILFLSFVILFSCKKEKEEVSTLDYTKDVLTEEISKMMNETGVPSFSIALIENDSIIWAEAFGYANVKTKTPATTATVYSTGSTIKPFMSMAIMQLVAKGVVELDKPVNNYLKEPISAFSPDSKPITLRHLLSHQAGFPSSASFIPIWDEYNRKTLQEIANGIQPIREPETAYEYANDGFVVCALVIETQTGMSYGEYVKNNILTPLQLNNINFFGLNPDRTEELALPYKLAHNKAFPISQQYSEPYPGGGMSYLTPSEMGRFLIAHLNDGKYQGNQLLEPEFINQFHETSFNHEYYGLGMGIEKKDNTTYLFHSGLQEGYTAGFKINLNKKTGVYVMANATAEQHVAVIVELATELLDGKKDFKALPSLKKPEFKEIKVDDNVLNGFTGMYKIEESDFYLTILKKQNKLFLKNPAKKEFELVPYQENKFYLKAEEENIEFIKYNDTIKEIILFSNGSQIKAVLDK